MLILSVFIYIALERAGLRYDLSMSRMHTLHPETVSLLKKVDVPIKFTVIQRTRNVGNKVLLYQTELNPVIYEFPKVNPLISIEIIDEEKNPSLVMEYNRRFKLNFGDRAIIATNLVTNKSAITYGNTEWDLDYLVFKVMRREGNYVLCFTTGHGEKNPDDMETRQGYYEIRRRLVENGYAVRRVRVYDGFVRENNCSAVIIAGPKQEFSDAEVNILTDYLKHGGKALIMIDPDGASLRDLLDHFGLLVGDGVIVDPA